MSRSSLIKNYDGMKYMFTKEEKELKKEAEKKKKKMMRFETKKFFSGQTLAQLEKKFKEKISQGTDMMKL